MGDVVSINAGKHRQFVNQLKDLGEVATKREEHIAKGLSALTDAILFVSGPKDGLDKADLELVKGSLRQAHEAVMLALLGGKARKR